MRLGDRVLFLATDNYNLFDCLALVTRVHDDGETLNLCVFVDGLTPKPLSAVPHDESGLKHSTWRALK